MKKLLLKAGWAPFSVYFVHGVISKIFGHNPDLDPAMHFMGGASMAYFFYHALLIYNNWFGSPNTIARSLIAFCFATTVAVFWEFLEFAGSQSPRGSYSQISIKETMTDLILGCSGALVYLIVSKIKLRAKL